MRVDATKGTNGTNATTVVGTAAHGADDATAPDPEGRGQPARRPLSARFPLLRQAEREARVWAQLWTGTVITGIVNPLLFLGAMGLGLGSLVDARGQVEGFDYLVFVTPGIMAAAAVQSAAGASLWPVMGGMKWTKSFHAAVVTPLTPGDVYGGYLLWQGVRLAMDATVFVVVAALLGAVPSSWGVLAVPAAVAGGLALAAPLIAFSARQDSDVPFSVIMRILVLPLYLFSGTFFPLDQLPAGLRPVAWVTPLWHAVELCRGATTGRLDLLPGLGHAAVLVAYIAVGSALGVRSFRSRLWA
ncbi:MAG TPA: ABC transporter permease [Acidimicrobiales bacterium]